MDRARVIALTLALIAAIAVPLCASSGWARGLGVLGMCGGATAANSDCLTGTSYTIGWGGEHPSGVDYACDGSETPLDGTTSGAIQIGTTWGEGGADVAMQIDAISETVSWSDSGGDKADINGSQTMWFRIYVSATPTGGNDLALLLYDGVNYIEVYVNSSLQVVGKHRAGPYLATVTSGTAISSRVWVDVAYSWDSANQDHSVNVGGAWTDDNDTLSPSAGTDFTTITVGPVWDFGMPASEYYRISKMTISNGYKAAKPW